MGRDTDPSDQSEKAQNVAKDDLEIAERLEKATAEAKDMMIKIHQAVKDLAQLNIYTRELIERKVDTEVGEVIVRHLEHLPGEVQKLLDGACDRAVKKFDEFVSILDGTDKKSRKKHEQSVADLIARHAVATAANERLLIVKKKER